MNTPLSSYLFPWQHAELIQQFALREVVARYRQSWLGTLWALLNPLLMLAVFTFVFRFVFNLRWNHGATDTDLGFALRLYAGLAVFNFFAECIQRAPRLVLEQPHLVKKVIFPVEILAWVNALAALFHLAVSLVLLVLLSFVESGGLHASIIALPLVWLSLLPLCVGLGWFLSGLGTYVRDVTQVVAMAVSFLMFLSPIFFPLEALPAAAQPWAALNPLALPISMTRQVLLDGHWPVWSSLAWHLLACMAVAVAGAKFFDSARKGFADVV